MLMFVTNRKNRFCSHEAGAYWFSVFHALDIKVCLALTKKEAVKPPPLSEENCMFHARGIKRIRTAVRGFADLCLTTRP